METVSTGITSLEIFKIIISAILIYAIIFAMLKQIKIFGEHSKVDSLVALIAAIIVSFSGAVTYAISYAINWFVIIIFIIFLFLVVIMFLGVKPDKIAQTSSENSKAILIAFIILFLGILLKGFFAVNNAYDINNPQNDPYEVNTDFNTGTDDLILKEGEEITIENKFDFDSDLIGVAGFLLIIGIFVLLIGR